MKGKRRKVLVVEDHPALRGSLRECVELLGLEPIEAADGNTALNRLSASAPDLVCLDVVLPESSGYEVCQFIRESPHLRDVPVLMMSGRGLANESAFAEEAGADAFLAKPFTRKDFERQVRDLLDSPRAVEGEDDEEQ